MAKKTDWNALIEAELKKTTEGQQTTTTKPNWDSLLEVELRKQTKVTLPPTEIAKSTPEQVDAELAMELSRDALNLQMNQIGKGLRDMKYDINAFEPTIPEFPKAKTAIEAFTEAKIEEGKKKIRKAGEEGRTQGTLKYLDESIGAAVDPQIQSALHFLTAQGTELSPRLKATYHTLSEDVQPYAKNIVNDYIAENPYLEYNRQLYEDYIAGKIYSEAFNRLLENDEEFFASVYEERTGNPYSVFKKEQDAIATQELQKIKAKAEAMLVDLKKKRDENRTHAGQSRSSFGSVYADTATPYGGNIELVEDLIDNIDDALEGSFSSGFDKAFDWDRVVTSGMAGLLANKNLNISLEAQRQGKPMTDEMQSYVDIYGLMEEVEGLRGMREKYAKQMYDKWLGFNLNDIGSGIGSSAELLPTFAIGMGATSGIGSFATLGTKAAMKAAFKAGAKETIKYGVNTAGKLAYNYGLAKTRGYLIAPVSAYTYNQYFQSLNSGYSFDENGELTYKPVDKGQAYLGSIISTANEVSSEYIGLGFSKVVGMGARNVGRALAGSKLAGLVKPLTQWMPKLSPQAKHAMFMMGVQTDPISETLSEAYGDMMTAYEQSLIGMEVDPSQFYTLDYWTTLFGVTLGYGGALSVAGGVATYKQVKDATKVREQILGQIDRRDLHDALVAISATDDVVLASAALAGLMRSLNLNVDEMRTARAYIVADTNVKILTGEVEENSRLKSFQGTLERVRDIAYQPTAGEYSDMIQGAELEDGTPVYIINGLEEGDTTGLLTVINPINGEKTSVAVDKVTLTEAYSVDEYILNAYSEQFSLETEQKRVMDTRNKAMEMTNPSDEDVERVASMLNISIPKVGNTVVLTNGIMGIVSEKLSPAEYALKAEDGTTYKVNFTDILSSDPLTAKAQTSIANGNTIEFITPEEVTAPEEVSEEMINEVAPEATSQAEGVKVIIDGREGTIVGKSEDGSEYAVSFENNGVEDTEIYTKEEIDAAMATMATPKTESTITKVDVTESGKVDVDKLPAPDAAKDIVNKAGSIEAAIEGVKEVMAGVAEERKTASKAQKKRSLNDIGKISEEVQALDAQLAHHGEVLAELEKMLTEQNAKISEAKETVPSEITEKSATEAQSESVGLIRNEAAMKMTDKVLELVDDIGKKLSVTIEFVDNLTNDQGQRVNGDIVGKKVRISTNGSRGVRFIIGHEFFHRVKDIVTPEQYAEFVKTVKDFFSEDVWNGILENHRNTYRQHNARVVTQALADKTDEYIIETAQSLGIDTSKVAPEDLVRAIIKVAVDKVVTRPESSVEITDETSSKPTPYLPKLLKLTETLCEEESVADVAGEMIQNRSLFANYAESISDKIWLLRVLRKAIRGLKEFLKSKDYTTEHKKLNAMENALTQLFAEAEISEAESQEIERVEGKKREAVTPDRGRHSLIGEVGAEALDKAEEARYSLQSPTFYSNAEYAVRNIKQEKATPEQWLKMIEKAGGLKAGEDKWLGLSDWLKTSDKKTLTKDEVLQYIAENDIQIEEVSYADVADISREEIYESAEFVELREGLTEYDEDDNPYINRERYDELRSESYDFVDGFSLDYWGEELEVNSPAAAATYLGLIKADKEINSTRLDYTTKGLENKREIALVVPTIEPYNQSDEIHFGDAGEGRAVAWIRFGDTIVQEPHNYSPEAKEWNEPYKNINNEDVFKPVGSAGKDAYVVHRQRKDVEGYVIFIKDKPISIHTTLEEARIALNDYYKQNPLKLRKNKYVLVIDEIQSKRHQDGREKGYSNRSVSQQELYEAQEAAFSKVIYYESALADKYGEDEWAALATAEEMAEYDRLRALDEAATNAYENYDKGVPSAPFEKNWAELAFKRMLRYAAENGYDYVAWTTGDQQADRYDIGSVVKDIVTYDTKDADGNPIKKMKFRMNNMGTYNIATNMEGVIVKGDGEMKEGMHLSDITGKPLAEKIMNGEGEDAMVFENGKDIEAKSLEGEELHIGNEGMKAFYDQMLPSFVKKYTKKWGAEVGEVTMTDLEENNTMHAVNVTDSMRESVMQGQPKFSLAGTEVGFILKNYDDIQDIATAVEAVVKRYPKDSVMLANVLDDYKQTSDEDEFIQGLRTFAKYFGDKQERDRSEDKATIEKTFGGIWIDDTEEFAKFVSAVNTYPTDENGEGIAKTSDYLYLYYRGIGERIIPFASVYLNKGESQNVANELINAWNNGEKEKVREYIDGAYEVTRDVNVQGNILDGTDKELSATRGNDILGSELSQLGRYYYTPELYSKVKRADSGSRGQGKVNYSLITPEMDASYLDAEERGDMATAQKMVKEAAKLAMPNTKVVDEDGNPKVVYHGTPNNFNAFSKEMFGTSTDRGIWGNGFYFSDSEQYAKTYEKRGDKQGKTLSVFLNIKRPLFISLRNGGNEGAMYFHELMEKHFTDDIYEDVTRTDELMSVAQERLTADIVANGYDGIVVEYTNHIDTEYIAFEPNQIKSADTVTYDDAGNVIPLSERFNPEKEDIRYSVQIPSLLGVHNISLDKLRKVIKMGGLANPSVAVIDVDKQTHDDYGEYSLILPNNMVDARKGKNAGTWAGDAWTPTYPSIIKRMTDDKAISRFYKDIDNLPEAMRSRVKLDFDSFMEGRSANALAYWYLFEKGNAPEMVLVPSRYSDDVTNAVSEATNNSFSMYGLTPEERAKCLDVYIAVKFNGDRAAFEEEMQARIDRLTETIETKKSDRVKKWAQDTIDLIKEYGFDYDDVAKFIRDVEYDAREKGTVNVDATITAAREQVEVNNLEADYDAWRNNLDERYGIEEYIFDGYTNSGDRRYLPHTVENASKWMKKQGRQGAVATFPSFGTFVAVSIPKMTTLESIRKRKALLGKSKEEYDAFLEKWENVYYELGKKLQPDAKSFDDYGYWRLIEAAGHKNPKEFVKKEYNIELSEEDMAQLNDMLNAIRTNYPARYFETKFERPLQLSDFVAAVVPNDIPLDVESRLKDANVEIFEYEKGNSNSRAEAMQKASEVENVRFSLQNEGYDGVIREEDGTIWEYVAFNPNQIKSADPVTYDDNGNVIPLSERFNPEREDIRYSLIGEKGVISLENNNPAGARLRDLNIARQMEKRGEDALKIKVATGWERGVDGLWRYEIDDMVTVSNVNKLYEHNGDKAQHLVRRANEEKSIVQAMYDGIFNINEEVRNSPSRTYEERIRSIYNRYKDASKMELLNTINDLSGKINALKNGGSAFSLEDVIGRNHPIFAAYPEMRSVGVITTKYNGGSTRGSYNWIDNTITISIYTGNIEDEVETLVHEMQHAIQHIEGFATGGMVGGLNPHAEAKKKALIDEYTKKNEDVKKRKSELEARNVEIAKALNEWKNTRQEGSETPADIQSMINEESANKNAISDLRSESRRLERNIDELRGMNTLYSYDDYFRIAGEVEARTVAKRNRYTSEQRRNTLAVDDSDVAPEHRILVHKGDIMSPKYSENVRFSLQDVEAHRFNRKVEFVKALVKNYNIPNPLFIAETKEEFVQMVKNYGGEVDEYTPETYGCYCPDDDIILLNGGMLITSSDAHRSTMHEYAHSITKKYLGEKLAEVTASILETEIDKARKEMHPEIYNGYSYAEVIDEFTSLLLEDLTIAETRAIFEGEMAIDTFVEKLKKDISAIEKLSNKDVLYAVIPLVVENLKIQKDQYGKDREHPIVIPRVDSRRNSTFSQTSHLSGDKKSRPSEAESRVYETGRGGESTQKEEVVSRYQLPDPDPSEAFYDELPVFDENGNMVDVTTLPSKEAQDILDSKVRQMLEAEYDHNTQIIRIEAQQSRNAINARYRDEKIKRRNGLNAARTNAARIDEIFGDTPFESLPLEVQALILIATGQAKIYWGDRGGKRGLASELGLKGSTGDRHAYRNIWGGAKKSFNEVVHDWWESIGGQESGIDDNDLRNALISALQSVQSSKDAMHELINNYDDLTIDRDRNLADVDHYEAQELRKAKDAYEQYSAAFELSQGEERKSYHDRAVQYFGNQSLSRVDDILEELTNDIERQKRKIERLKAEKKDMYTPLAEGIAKSKEIILHALERIRMFAGMEEVDLNDATRLINMVKSARSNRQINNLSSQAQALVQRISIKKAKTNLGRLLSLKLSNPDIIRKVLANTENWPEQKRTSMLKHLWKVSRNGLRVSEAVHPDTRVIVSELKSLINHYSKGNDVERGEILHKMEVLLDPNIEDIDKEKEFKDYADKNKQTAFELFRRYKELLDTKVAYEMASSKVAKQRTEGVKGSALAESMADKQVKGNEYLQQLQLFNQELESLIVNGKEEISAFYLNKENHAKEIRSMGINAVGNTRARLLPDVNPKGKTKIKAGLKKANAVKNATINAPYWTFETVLAKIDKAGKSGKLYTYFMNQFTDSVDAFYERERKHAALLADAMAEFFPKMNGKLRNKHNLFTRVMRKADDTLLPTTLSYLNNDNGRETLRLTISSGMYAIAMWRQPRYQESMRVHGITDAVIDNIYREISEVDAGYISLMDWVNFTLLPDTRLEYDQVYRALYGGSMAKEVNYFPAKVLHFEEVKLDEKTGLGTLSMSPSALKERTSVNGMPNLNMNYFKVLQGHLQNMDQWASFAQMREDLSTLLSSKEFKNRLNELQPGLKADGGGEGGLFNNLFRTSKIATGLFEVDYNKATEIFSKAQQKWASANIAYRFWTAAKQIASIPIFAFYKAHDPRSYYFFVKALGRGLNPFGAVKRAMNLSPSLRHRWESKFAGLDVLMQETSKDDGIAKYRGLTKRTWDAITDFVGKVTKLGMGANAAVDIMACAVGVNMIYDYEIYKATGGKREATEEEKRDAIRKAEYAFNSTQQSSEGAYMSAIQMNPAASMYTVYMNASMAAHRKRSYGLEELWKSFTSKEYKQFITDEFGRLGLWKKRGEMISDLLQGLISDTAFVFMGSYGGLLGMSLLFDRNDDDDDDDKEEYKRSFWIDAGLSMLNGYLFGGLVSSGIKNGEFVFNPALNELSEDIKKLLDDKGNWVVETAQILTQFGIGVDLKTFYNIVAGVQNALFEEEDGDYSGAFLKILNAPTGYIKAFVGDRREGESVEEYMLRIVRLHTHLANIEYKDVFDENGKPILEDFYSPSMSQKQLNELHKEAENEYRRNILIRKGGLDVYKSYMEAEKVHKDICDLIGYDPYSKPSREKQEKSDVAWEMAYYQEDVAYVVKERTEWFGDEEEYYNLLKDEQKAMNEFINAYYEYIKQSGFGAN